MASNTTTQTKATNDAYTGMLAISLIALLIGTGTSTWITAVMPVSRR